MKTKPLTYLLALTFLISGSTIVSAKQKFGDYEGAIYFRNYDGDTITFNLPNLHPIIGKNIRARLNGIDTPEIKGIRDKEKHDAEQARDMVGDILKDAEKITLKNMQRGNYFRIASDVIIDGESLADILSEAGMAVRYDGGKKTHKWCDPINE
jgi:endonuclease YncB( thermonuclease family)